MVNSELQTELLLCARIGAFILRGFYYSGLSFRLNIPTIRFQTGAAFIPRGFYLLSRQKCPAVRRPLRISGSHRVKIGHTRTALRPSLKLRLSFIQFLTMFCTFRPRYRTSLKVVIHRSSRSRSQETGESPRCTRAVHALDEGRTNQPGCLPRECPPVHRILPMVYKAPRLLGARSW